MVNSVPDMETTTNPIDALRFRIEQYGWTDAKFAKAVGMAASHFSEVMNGKRKMPIVAIRKAVELGVPAKLLLLPFPCEIKTAKKNGKPKRKA